MKLETVKELHRHYAGIVAALRKEIQEAEHAEEVKRFDELTEVLAAADATDK